MEFYKIAADDFSRTRYKMWAGVKDFLSSIPDHSFILDAGCGNGKNMIETNHRFIGIDTCQELLNIVKDKTSNNPNVLGLFNASVLKLPFLDSSFDAVMSIAVIHHIESEKGRLKAFDELIRVCKRKGKILVTLWRKENNRYYDNGKMLENSNNDGDRLVQWKLDGTILYRFYHFYSYDEISNIASYLENKYKVTVKITDENYNYYVIIDL